jgi:hypothetical protein
MPVDMVLADPWFIAATDAEAWGMLKMMAAAWRQIPAGSLPNNDAYIWEITRIRDRKGLVKASIRKQWKLCSDGRLYHPQLSKMVEQSMANGKQPGGKKRRGGWSSEAHIRREENRGLDTTSEEEEIAF